MAAASAIPKVAEVLKGSFDESLKKLVQPASIVPATIFVLILLVTVYPPLKTDGNRIVKAFDDFDDVWKAAALTGIVIVVGYVLLSLSGTIMRLATGESWRHTWLAGKLVEQHRLILPDLYARAAAAHAAGDGALESRLLSEIATTPDDVMTSPTRLGQVMNGMSGSVARRYGIDPSGLWPHMYAVIASKDKDLSARVDDDTVQLQVLLNLAAVLALSAVILLAFYLLRSDWTAVLWVGLLLVIAYLLYSAAVPAARQYADDVESVFDLYRKDLATALGVTLPEDPDKARAKWQSLSASLLFDDDKASAALAPEAKDADPLTIKASSNVETTIVPTPISKVGPDLPAGSARITWSAGYTLIVTSKRRDAGTAVVAVLDKRMKAPPPAASSRDNTAVGTPLPPGDDGAGTLWRFPDLAAGAARSVPYDYVVGDLSVRVAGARALKSVGGDLDEPGSGNVEIALLGDDVGATLMIVDGSRFIAGDVWTVLLKTGDDPLATTSATVDDQGLALLVIHAAAPDISTTWFKADGDA